MARATKTTVERAQGARSIGALRRRASVCTACPLHARATQTVFSEGPVHASLMLVGEEPGAVEDERGRPFVGPAGHLLDAVLAEIGVDRSSLYLTNAVKHFKWVPAPRGKRRLHAKPTFGEVAACFGWLDAEIELVKPKAIVCLGAVAAQAFQGTGYRLLAHRGELDEGWPWIWMATYHPAAVLRKPDADSRRRAREALARDLAKVARLVGLLG